MGGFSDADLEQYHSIWVDCMHTGRCTFLEEETIDIKRPQHFYLGSRLLR